MIKPLLLLALLLTGATQADTLINKDTKFSIHTGSYIKHIVPNGKGLNQKLGNKFFDIEFKLDNNKYFDKTLIGTFLNSEGNRCILLGVQKDWKNINNRLTFEGVYAYAGEFFFSTFEHCGDAGPYNKIRNKTGVGFAPYIYHGLEYGLNKHISLELGFIAPLIAVSTIQFHF